MSNVVLTAQKRNSEELKKNASRRLRSAGYIPCVVYGLEDAPLEIKIAKKDLKDTIKGRSLSNLILDLHLAVDGKDKKETTLIKEIQKDPISTEFIHIDFIRIQMKKEVEAVVPIHILSEEESTGIKEEGGVLQHGLREIHVICLPADIPEKIEYDIKELHLGENIRVSDLTLEESIKILNNPEEVIVSIIHPTHLVVEVPEEEAVEEEVEAEEPELITREKETEKESEKVIKKEQKEE